ncbi:MAG: DNA/RNA nuclease SfsA [Spirochaetaceae bacterium]
MKLFQNDVIAEFRVRPNRFIIHALIDGEVVICHCPNTGRMKELLFPGVKLILEKSTNPNRKTAYSVVAVYKENLIVPITSARANDVAGKLIIPRLFNKPEIRSEVTYGKSRFDFLVEDGGEKTFIEVKSCTLFNGLEAIFPDAPTTRGVKHLNELELAIAEGYKAMVILVVFNPNSTSFSPNNITDPTFATTLKRVAQVVKIVPFKVGVNSEGFVTIPELEPILPIIYKDIESDK